MVSIVIVSHSSGVASGAREMAGQMAGEVVIIASCGGNKAGGIGTDPDAIREAINRAWSDDGVLILADLGSAVMSAEFALEMLPEERRQRVWIADAPVVEGAVLAAVEASMGRSLAQVLAAAEGAREMHKIRREG